MATESTRHGTVDELLILAGVSTEDSAARRWLESALAAARGTLERRLAATGATHVPQPSPAKHNLPLKKVERAVDQLIAALEQLRRHPCAHASFWRFAAFGPVYADEFERAGVTRTLTNIRDADTDEFERAGVTCTLTNIRDTARNARESKTGRPRKIRKTAHRKLSASILRKIFAQATEQRWQKFLPALC